MEGAARLPRSPCFGLCLLAQGGGVVQVDHAQHAFEAPTLLCLNPYQHATFPAPTQASGRLLRFHANFFCIETHHHAVGCNGVLFNEVYEAPLVTLDAATLADFDRLMSEMDAELCGQQVAHLEVLLSSLKILLIKATRMKLAQQGALDLAATRRPEILRRLRDLVEERYTTLHSPSVCAAARCVPQDPGPAGEDAFPQDRVGLDPGPGHETRPVAAPAHAETCEGDRPGSWVRG